MEPHVYMAQQVLLYDPFDNVKAIIAINGMVAVRIAYDMATSLALCGAGSKCGTKWGIIE